ncbi:hypothetical protein SAMN07250955_104108 [Arboricoccus pini]|uniref:AB hydrolase-1 domain-containing protein n=1 Tax=Arboricoccus pini TaxID=1963835 RepID=A0A212QYD3_9PROT|nr:alpha/beta hydrolase [Arboricoccus pini]SNB64586.1 hypothetical protein SAMN07250955_104108 [Arboricoccus pini]
MRRGPSGIDRPQRWQTLRGRTTRTALAIAIPLMMSLSAQAQVFMPSAGDTSPVNGRLSDRRNMPAPQLPTGTGPMVETIRGALGGNVQDLPDVPLSALSIMRVQPFPDRPVPKLFWYFSDGLELVVFKQDKPAPLVFVIAGTGSSGESPTVQILGRLLYAQGMNVVIIPSPSHPQFVVTASRTFVPGVMQTDAADLLRVMQMARAQLSHEIQITNYKLVGFSLGAMHAAFVGELDSREHAFNFSNVVLINPPDRLDHSITLIDSMLQRYTERDPAAVDRFIRTVFAGFAQVYAQSPTSDLSPEVLFGTFALFQNRFDLLEMLIGLSFRISVANLAFTSDVMTHSGVFIPADARPGIANSLTDVFKVGLDHTLRDYVEGLALPYLARHPELVAPAPPGHTLLEQASLATIGPYLHQTPTIAAITNQDDIILAPGDLKEMKSILGDRLTVLSSGGHGGSIGRPDFDAAFNRMIGQ